MGGRAPGEPRVPPPLTNAKWRVSDTQGMRTCLAHVKTHHMSCQFYFVTFSNWTLRGYTYDMYGLKMIILKSLMWAKRPKTIISKNISRSSRSYIYMLIVEA